MSTPGAQAFRVGSVALTVRDLRRVADFYLHAIGLHLQEDHGSTLHLGNGSTTLLELRHDPHARTHSPRDAGLFHTAFLLPSRASLGAWVRHAYESRAPITGAADHLVSEAIYLNDPEGNGIEVYADRPRSQWSWNNGIVHMTTEPLDFKSVVDSGADVSWQGFPRDAIVGHVHLQVGDLAEAEDFYASSLGLDVTCRYPGAIFYSSEGYHHHIATNTWNSRGAQRRVEVSTGLSAVDVLLGNVMVAEDLRVRLVGAGIAVEGQGTHFHAMDPWNIRFTFRA